MAGLTCTKLTLFTIAGVAIQLVGLSLFVFGFFPVKPTLPGHRYYALSQNYKVEIAAETKSEFLFLYQWSGEFSSADLQFDSE